MTIRFDEQVAIVTGAGNGLGKTYALALAARGAKVVVNDLGASLDGTGGSSKPAAEVVAQIEQQGGEAIANGANVTKIDEVEKMVQVALEKWGRIDILINNVGDFIFKPLMETSDSEFSVTVESNLHAAFFCSRRVLESMGPGYGRIINIGAVGADRLLLRKRTAPYYIAKTGLFMLTKILSLECGEGTTVNMVSPGVLPNGIRPDGARVVAYEDVTRAVLFLAGEDAKEVNGANIEVSGGWSLGMN